MVIETASPLPLLIGTTIAAYSMASHPALAQDGAGARPASAADAADSPAGEIVVTAQKRSQSLQNVPAAVTALGGERLEALGLTNLSQIGNVTPGVSIVPIRSQALISIRGVGQTLTTPNADAAVATNLNGVYLPAEIAGTSFFDIDRIEVLPGPQGTLYGRNSTGGVINLASRKPGDHSAADGFVEIGNYSRRKIAGTCRAS